MAEVTGAGGASLAWIVLRESIHKGKDLGHCLVNLRWNLLLEIEARQDFDEVFILAHGDVMGLGSLQDTSAREPRPLAAIFGARSSFDW
jgi:hypothetical protein